jgi:2'-5' RNA ligase
MLTQATKASAWDKSEAELSQDERQYVRSPGEEQTHREQQDRIDEWRFKKLTPDLKIAKKDELHVGLGIPKPIGIEIHNWAEEQDWPEGTELEPIEEYHITMLYSPEGHDHKDDQWMDHEAHAVSIKGIKSFPSKEKGEGKDAIVLTVDSETIALHHKELASNAEEAGIEISPFSHGDFKPHMTIAYGTLPSGLKPPKLTFETEPSSVSPPREEEEDSTEKHSWHIVRQHAPYEAELLRFADSWTPKDQWPSALRERNGEPVDADCTCKDGHKLDCPVHGMHPTLPTYDDTLEFPDPNSPVGYDYHTDAPRTWMRAETKFAFTRHKLWLDDTRHPPDESWDWAKDAAEAKKLTKDNDYKHMSLDHDLGIVRYEDKVVINPDALSGGDFAIWLHEHRKHLPKSVNIHSHNGHGIKLMKEILEKHAEVTTDRAPDDLEEEWAREFKVHEPSEIEKEVVHLPERTASHQLAWLPGSNLRGKGLVTPSGDVHTWPVDKHGIPHHAEYVDQRQPYQLGEGNAHFFQIRPRGGLDTKGYNIPADVIHHVLQTVPSLRAGESTDWHFAADEFDTREYPDARMMPPITMGEPAQGNPHPEKQGCTCELGHKLDCPVHGLNPTEQDFDHSWSIPQGHPVGYPQDQPRNYMKAEGSVVGDRGERDDAKTDSNADQHVTKQSTDDSPEGDNENSIGIDHGYSIACDCPACEHTREHAWHVQGQGTSEEGWSGLPRAEGAVEDEDEHGDNLEGEDVAIPKPPIEIRKKRKEQEDLELVQEKPVLHSSAWQIQPASLPSKLVT